ncbi:hypothetical protein ACFW9F_05140 [Streptomyces sp. NPDC059506]|uniref:hypothetical protein n=1 Tax=Streptomyces sp. NPDC059506 TaxID=3347751 RepID=UPI0036B83C80
MRGRSMWLIASRLGGVLVQDAVDALQLVLHRDNPAVQVHVRPVQAQDSPRRMPMATTRAKAA